MDLIVTDPEGEHHSRLRFSRELTDTTQTGTELLALVARARAASGEQGATSAEREAAETARMRTFLAEVVHVDDLHPHLRRITFGGPSLRAFRPVGPDTFPYVLLPPPGRRQLTIGEDFSWDAYRNMAPAERPVGAYYTVRRRLADEARLEMLIVVHGDDGPASAWAAGARPGDPVALWGPRTAYAPPRRPTGICPWPTRRVSRPWPASSRPCRPATGPWCSPRSPAPTNARSCPRPPAGRSPGCTATAPRPARPRSSPMPSSAWPGPVPRPTPGVRGRAGP